MTTLIDDFFRGLIIISFLAAANSLTKAMFEKAAQAHKVGLMSYSKYTKMLTDK